VQKVIPTPAGTALSCRTSSGQHVTTALPQVDRQPSAQPPDLPFIVQVLPNSSHVISSYRVCDAV